jgi:hypothetical protein
MYQDDCKASYLDGSPGGEKVLTQQEFLLALLLPTQKTPATEM